MSDSVISELAATIRSRRLAKGDTSYTRQLLDAGAERCARKFGEEAIETVIAGVSQDAASLASEAADVVYHLLVLLEVRDLTWVDVERVLQSRVGTSGLAEKARRGEPSQ